MHSTSNNISRCSCTTILCCVSLVDFSIESPYDIGITRNHYSRNQPCGGQTYGKNEAISKLRGRNLIGTNRQIGELYVETIGIGATSRRVGPEIAPSTGMTNN